MCNLWMAFIVSLKQRDIILLLVFDLFSCYWFTVLIVLLSITKHATIVPRCFGIHLPFVCAKRFDCAVSLLVCKIIRLIQASQFIFQLLDHLLFCDWWVSVGAWPGDEIVVEINPRWQPNIVRYRCAASEQLCSKSGQQLLWGTHLLCQTTCHLTSWRLVSTASTFWCESVTNGFSGDDALCAICSTLLCSQSPSHVRCGTNLPLSDCTIGGLLLAVLSLSLQIAALFVLSHCVSDVVYTNLGLKKFSADARTLCFLTLWPV